MSSSRPWHKRWHGNALVGMRSLSLELRGAYNTLLDLMYDAGGPIPLEERRLCGEFDCDIRVFKRVMSALLAAGKIRLWSDGSTVWIVNDRVLEELKVTGYLDDTCAELTRQVRDKFGIAIADLSPKSEGKPKENNEEKNSEAKKTAPRGRGRRRTPIVPSGDEPKTDIETAFDLWNETAGKLGLAEARGLTDARRRAIGKRLEAAGLDGWREALAAVAASAFCRGQRPGRDGAKPFRADLDFVCQAKSFQRLIEGYYGDDAKPAPTTAAEADPAETWRAALREFVANAWWPDNLGPRPGRVGCTAPLPILAEFGFAPPLALVTGETAARPRPPPASSPKPSIEPLQIERAV